MEEAVKLIKILDRFKTQDLRLKTHQNKIKELMIMMLLGFFANELPSKRYLALFPARTVFRVSLDHKMCI